MIGNWYDICGSTFCAPYPRYEKVSTPSYYDKIKNYSDEIEIEELKKDVEILLNIYLQNREMNKKEIERFSKRHYDIIEKQNAKTALKRGKKDDKTF